MGEFLPQVQEIGGKEFAAGLEGRIDIYGNEVVVQPGGEIDGIIYDPGAKSGTFAHHQDFALKLFLGAVFLRLRLKGAFVHRPEGLLFPGYRRPLLAFCLAAPLIFKKIQHGLNFPAHLVGGHLSRRWPVLWFP